MKYQEIFRLKKMLEDADIPFTWRDGWGYGKERMEEIKKIAPDLVEHYQICYPTFDEKYRCVSVIEGFGTYGAEEDRLEIMGLLTPEEQKHDRVVGHLSAEEVFKRIQNHYNRKGVYGMKTIKAVDEETLEMKEVYTEEQDEDIRTQIRSTLNCKPEEFAEKYAAYKKAEAEFKELYEPFKTNLLNLYNNTSDLPKTVIVGGVKVTYVSPSIRSAIDSKKLKEEEPELAKKFTKTTEVGATIRLEGI